MDQLTLLLFQRMGMLLMLTFILTRFPLFRQLLDRELGLITSLQFSFLFGLFGVAGTYAGIVVDGIRFNPAFLIMPLAEEEAIANSGLVGVVIGGLMGGPVVGLGAGLITGLHLYSLGGFAAFACGLSAPLTGLLAGFMARFFAPERVISPVKALFVGMFAPILQMMLILIFSRPADHASAIVNTIGIPMVISNSISIAIFTTMIRLALKEEERSAAVEAQRAFSIAEHSLHHLKQGLTPQTAAETARLLKKELEAAAIALTDTEQVLAHVGAGAGHHRSGERLTSPLARKAIESGTIQVAQGRSQIPCHHEKCPLGASIFVPFSQSGRVSGLIIIYYKRPQQISKIEEAMASGLGKLISNQLDLAAAERLTSLMRDAELRLLQAQINPHFLFNTLNSIVTLIRIDPELARHVTVQLGIFMRLNLRLTASRLVPIRDELNHLNAYLNIVRIRFSDQFSVECEADPGIEDVLIPPVTLQPLVENSIHHGFREKTSDGVIRIQVRRTSGRVRVVIEDNGSGIKPEVLDLLGEKPIREAAGNGIGVFNVNQRLVTLFGPEAKLRFGNKENGGCRITFSIPITPPERSVR